MHVDSTASAGPFAWVLSLARPSAARRGGETLLLKDEILNYWGSGAASGGGGLMMPGLFDRVAPEFNRLVVFDARLPHGVSDVSGPLDPLDGRLVLHGWFHTPRPGFHGSLTEEEVVPVLDAGLDDVYDAFERILGGGADVMASGMLVLQMTAGADGHVRSMRVTCDCVRVLGGTAPDGVRGALAAAAEERLGGLSFPATDGDTVFTLPFAFE